MLPLLLTVLLALYILGPDLLSRWILGFVVPRRAVTQTKGEELARAFIWCAGPLFLAWTWARYVGHLRQCGGSAEIAVFFSCLYSEATFSAHQDAFFASARAVFWLNWCLLWRLYCLVIAGSVFLNFIISRYGPLRKRLEGHDQLQNLLALLALPRVSEWHVRLSRMLLPSADVQLHVDILTKSDNLYQGRLADKMLGPDGALVSLTLKDPSQFRRPQYLEAAKLDPKASAHHYWRKIPGETFVVMASDIGTMNLRYVTSRITPEILEALHNLLRKQA